MGGHPGETNTDTDTGDTRQLKQGRNRKLAKPDVIKPGQTFNDDVLYPLSYFLIPLCLYFFLLFFLHVRLQYLPRSTLLQPIPVCVLLVFRAASSGQPLEFICFRKLSYTENQYN